MGANGESFSSAIGNTRAEPGDGHEILARDIQPRLERQAVATWACLARPIQIRAVKCCGGESVLFAHRGGLHSSKPGTSRTGGRKAREARCLQVEQSGGLCEGQGAGLVGN